MLFEDLSVVGSYHRGRDVMNLVATLQPGEKLELRREPTNAHDPNAVMVFFGDTHIGYIAREQAFYIAAHADGMSNPQMDCEVTHLQVNTKGSAYPVCRMTLTDGGSALAGLPDPLDEKKEEPDQFTAQIKWYSEDRF